MIDLGIEFPALVDDIDNTTELAYTAWPERIYLVGADGNIILKSAPGPFGFEPDDLAAELEKLFPDVPELPDDEEEKITNGAADEGSGSRDEPPAAIPPIVK